MSNKTTVRLLSWTQNPVETIYAEWVQSRTQDSVPNPAVLHKMMDERMQDYREAKAVAGDNFEGDSPDQEILDVFEKVVAMKMPLGETVSFVFLLEHVPVALREQLVRHRIGHKFGDRIGADIVPDLAGTSSFWTQTTRIIDMGKFATEGEYLTPVWLEENPDKQMPSYKGTIAEFYKEQMLWIQAAYRRLVAAGMPLEDARNLLPVGMMHRMTWTTNLSALMHVLSRRGCWLAQLGMWEPVIHGIVEELATRIHPTFRRLIDPPCIGADGKFNACAFGRENEEIAGNPGKGEYPPCSLWVNENQDIKGEIGQVGEVRMDRYLRMMTKYEKLWMRDPRTGERKCVA